MGAQVGEVGEDRQCHAEKPAGQSLVACALCPGMYISRCTVELVAACAKVPTCY